MPEASEFDQWEPEDALDNSNCPVTAIIPTWRTLTTLDMSHNSISEIDDSVVRNTLNFWKKSMTYLWHIIHSRDFGFALSLFLKTFHLQFMLVSYPS